VKHFELRSIWTECVCAFGDQEYALGSTEAGLARAIRRMSELRREIQAEVACALKSAQEKNSCTVLCCPLRSRFG
jgi:hypothetical protein